MICTYLTGYVDDNLLCYLGGFPGDGLSSLFGVISEEIDSLYSEDHNQVQFQNGSVVEVKDYAEILRVQDGEVLATYMEDFYQGTPAVTKKKTGKGYAYYIGARMKPDAMKEFWKNILVEADVAIKELPEGVEYHKRSGEEGTYEFYLNYTSHAVTIKGCCGRDLLSGTEADGEITLEGYEACVISNLT